MRRNTPHPSPHPLRLQRNWGGRPGCACRVRPRLAPPALAVPWKKESGRILGTEMSWEKGVAQHRAGRPAGSIWTRPCTNWSWTNASHSTLTPRHPSRRTGGWRSRNTENALRMGWGKAFTGAACHKLVGSFFCAPGSCCVCGGMQNVSTNTFPFVSPRKSSMPGGRPKVEGNLYRLQCSGVGIRLCSPGSAN